MAWIEGLLGELGARRAGRKWQCPAHARVGEHTVSLNVGPRADGLGAFVQCHGGCDLAAVLRSLRLAFAHLRTPPPVDPARHRVAHRLPVGFPVPKAGGGSGSGTEGFRHEAFHPYGPDVRKERLRHPTTGAKTIRWESRNPAGEWVPGLLGRREIELSLYREDAVVEAWRTGEVVVLCESESSVEALVGVHATCWAGGSSAPPLDHLAAVFGTGERVVMVADADDAGRACAVRIAEALPALTVLLPDVEGQDARDLYAARGGPGFAELVGATFRPPGRRPPRSPRPVAPRSTAVVSLPPERGPRGTFAEQYLARLIAR